MRQLVKKIRDVIKLGKINFNSTPDHIIIEIDLLIKQEGEAEVLKALQALEPEFLKYKDIKPSGSGMAYEHALRECCWYVYHHELLRRLRDKNEC